MAKLKAEKGTVFQVSEMKVDTLNVLFKKAALAPNGDFGEVRLWTGGAEVVLTFPQAISLANEIIRRCT